MSHQNLSVPRTSPVGIPCPVLVVHGGAGHLRAAQLTPPQIEDYRRHLHLALDAGWQVLAGGGGSLEAVERAVVVLEDCPLFNAGRGAALNAEGRCELDAAVADGATGGAGAVAAVTTVRNPVRLARAVMSASPHVLLVGPGAEAFARSRPDLPPPVDNGYFVTPARRQEWEHLRKRLATTAGESASAETTALSRGTVGAVALDDHGHLAAATSTGGMTNKWPGRVGDSPLVGAGTFADDATCAVSATGHGEHFIRAVAAADVAAQMAYRGWSLGPAAEEVIRKIGVRGGEGGLIAVDRSGQVALPFNTPSMLRAWRRGADAPRAELFGAA